MEPGQTPPTAATDGSAESTGLWREALKAGGRWWIAAGVFALLALVFIIWPVGGQGVLPAAGSVLGTAARIALVVGVAGVALAMLRIATNRLARRAAPTGPTPTAERERRAKTLARTAWNLGAGSVLCVSVLMVLAIFGVPVSPLVAAASVGGLALTLASQRLLKDYIAGAEFLVDDVVAVGEWITAKGVTGRAVDVGLRALTLQGFDGTRHRIPNSAIEVLANHSREPAATLLEVEVGYVEDPHWLVELCTEEAQRLGDDPALSAMVAGPPTPLGVHHLGRDTLTARVRVPCLPFAGPALARALRDRIGERLAADGRAIAAPFRVVALPVDEPG